MPNWLHYKVEANICKLICSLYEYAYGKHFFFFTQLSVLVVLVTKLHLQEQLVLVLIFTKMKPHNAFQDVENVN